MEQKLTKVAKQTIGQIKIPQKVYELKCWGGAFNDGPINGIEGGEYMSPNKSLIDDLEKNLKDHAKDLLMIERFETYAPMDKCLKYIVEVKFNDGAENDMVCIQYPIPQDFDINVVMYKIETLGLLQFFQEDYLKRVQSIEVIHAYAIGAFDLQHVARNEKMDVYTESDIDDYLNNEVKSI